MTSSFMRRALLAVGVSAAALSAYGAAYGAEAAPPAPADTNTVETIVVTAQRREETANSVGMAIEAFRGEQLKDLHVTDVKDLSTVAPSFSVSQSYQGIPTYTLRGIGFNTINMSATSTVGTYTDEVAYAYPIMNTGPMFDLGRVEVLKGPQGTLYGRNTTAGLIDFVTNKPTKDIQAQATVDVGNYKTLNFEGVLSGPLGDKAQARLAFRRDSSEEGWQVSNTRGDRLGKVDKLGIRGSLALQPADGLTIDASLSYWQDKSEPLAAQAIAFNPATNGSPFNAPGLAAYVASHQPTSATQADWEPYAQRTADIGTGLGLPGALRNDNSFVAGKLRVGYEFSDALRMVSLTSYNKLDREATFDWSGAPYEILAQRGYGSIKSIAEELHFEGEAGRLNWLAGLYYGKDKILDADRTLLGDHALTNQVTTLAIIGVPAIGLPPLGQNPFNSAGYTVTQMAQAFRTYTDIANFETETKSVFVNADWKVSDELKLTGAVRYTQDSQKYAGCSRDFNGNMLPNVNVFNRTFYFGVYGATPAPITTGDCVTFSTVTKNFGIVTSKLDEDNVAWRLAVNYQPSSALLVYGSISRGAKAGSTPVNAANIASQNAPAKQELLTAYEAGVKAGLFDRRVQANVAVFYYDYQDKQLSSYFKDPIFTALARLQNVPKSEAYGIDGDVTWRATSELTVIAAGTALHTEIKGFTGTNAAGLPESFDGKPFLYSPEFQGSLTVLYKHDLTENLGLQAALNGHTQSKSHADLSGDPLFTIPSYSLLNGSIGIHSLKDRWELSIWGRNLTDEYYYPAISNNSNLIVRFPGTPRTFGISATVKY
jgi:iron complex outermembrane receptor protein